MQEKYSSEHDQDCSTNDEHYKLSDDGPSGNGESSDNGKYSQDPLVMAMLTSSRSEMVEVSSLLSLAMPMANVNLLVNEGGGKDEAVAIEVRPRERQFWAYITPPAKWSAIILWLPSGAVSVYILKMDRRVVECKEFRHSETLEAVDFIKSHTFINTRWTLCPGASDISPMSDKFFEDYENGALIDRSAKCELLVSAKDGKSTSIQCKFCQKAGTYLKREASIFDHKNPSEEGQKVKEEQVEFDSVRESNLEHEDEHAAEKHESILVNLKTTETKLPGGWLKRIVPRKSGASAGQADAYLYAPDGTVIRSTKSLADYCSSSGIKIDPSVINLEKPRRRGKHRKAEVRQRSSDQDNGMTNSLTDGMRLRRLALWKYFTVKDDVTAACNACNKKLHAQRQGRMANLIRDDIQ